MAEDGAPRWLVVDGYEDEPAAFGVPPYVGFHVRYLCGVLEAHGLPYDYLTVDAWRALGRQGEDAQRAMLQGRAGLALLAGAVVPGKYLRATPISLPETKSLLRMLPAEVPAVLGGWAIRGWRHQGWSPLRRGLSSRCRTPTPRCIISSVPAAGSTSDGRPNSGRHGPMPAPRRRRCWTTRTFGTRTTSRPVR